MKSNRFLLVNLLFLLCFWLPAFASEPQVIRVGAFDYYPAIFKDSDGIIKGFYVEALADLATREHLRLEYVHGTWNQGLERIRTGEVDLLTSVAFTPERAEFLDFTATPLQTVWGELYAPETTDIHHIKDVAGRKIAVMKGDFNGRYFIDLVKNFELRCEFVEMPDFDTIFAAVAAREVDAGVVNSTYGAARQKDFALHSTGIVFNPFDIFFAVAKGKNQELLALLEKNLHSWCYHEDSVYRQAQQRWAHGRAGIVHILPSWFLKSLTLLLLLGLLTIIFVALLRMKVKEATRDILRSKAVLQESEEKYRSLLQTAIDGFWRRDCSGRILEVNETYCRMSGYSASELLGMNVGDLCAEGDGDNVSARTEQLMAEGEVRFQARHRRKDGSIFDVEISSQYRPVDGGQIVAFLKDVSAEKRAEAYLLMGREVLRVFNEPGEMRDLMTQAVGIMKALSDCDAVGIRLQEEGDFPYVVLDGFPPDFLLRENSLVVRRADGGLCRDKDGQISLECTCGLVICGKTDPVNPLFTPGGSFWTNDSRTLLDIPLEEDPRLHPRNQCIHLGYDSIALVPIRSKEKIVGLIQFNDRRKNYFTPESVGFLEGIGLHLGAALMRKRSEEERLILEQQFQEAQKMESLGVLASGIAHDFNNILSVILGSCFLGKKNPETTGDQLAQIEKAAERGADLCRQMLAYAGKTQISRVQVDMGQLVNEMLKMLRVSIKKNVTIHLSLLPDLHEITGDVSQIRQIVMNLVLNAAEAIGEARGEIHLRLERQEFTGASEKDYLGKEIAAGSYLCLEVADSGCGMSAETKKRLFEPFYTTKLTGRGLGMSATLGIIKGHNAALQLFSEPGQGSTFRIYFPLQDDKAKSLELPLPAVDAPWQGSGTILLVDDEEGILLAVSAMLQHLGFTVLSAADGREALKLYQEHTATIDLVLADRGMPVMSGYDLIFELKKINAGLPIIISSGFDEVDTPAQIAAGEVAAFLGKPYTFEQLREVLKKIVEEMPSKKI